MSSAKISAKTTPEVCRRFLAGKCDRGSKCPHSHPKTAKAATISGKGDYRVALPSRSEKPTAMIDGKLAGKHIGRKIGSLVGAKTLGGRVGDALHRGLHFLTGWGDYTEKSDKLNEVLTTQGYPTHADAVLQGYPAKFRSATNGVVITNREFIANVKSSTSAFATTTYPIQPGLLTPWLPPIAASYEQYKILGMVFEYVSTSGPVVSGSGAMGAVVLSSTYDPARKPFTTAAQALNSIYAVDGRPCDTFYHLVECDPAQLPHILFDVRTTPATTTADLRLSDVGFVQVSTSGNPTNGDNIGQLWVSYSIEFYKPLFTSQAIADLIPYAYYCDSTWSAFTDIFTSQVDRSSSNLSRSTLPIILTAYPAGVGCSVSFLNCPAGAYGVDFGIACQNAAYYYRTLGAGTPAWNFSYTGGVSLIRSALDGLPAAASTMVTGSNRMHDRVWIRHTGGAGVFNFWANGIQCSTIDAAAIHSGEIEISMLPSAALASRFLDDAEVLSSTQVQTRRHQLASIGAGDEAPLKEAPPPELAPALAASSAASSSSPGATRSPHTDEQDEIDYLPDCSGAGDYQDLNTLSKDELRVYLATHP